MNIRRMPGKFLERFVEQFWLADMRGAASTPGARENVLPVGAMGIVFRLSGEPLKIFEGDSEKTYRPAVIGGARSRFYTKDISEPAYSVGVILKPESAGALFCFSAEEFAGGHVSLEDVWGNSARVTLERLAEARNHHERIEIFESLLVEKTKNACAPHPAIVDAVKRLSQFESVDSVVRASGFSHRHFARMFRRHTGFQPKAFSRIKRFQKAVKLLSSGFSFSDVAFAAGYSDQSHFSRDFMEFAGVTPGEYRKAAPLHANHVPIRPPFRYRPGRGF